MYLFFFRIDVKKALYQNILRYVFIGIGMYKFKTILFIIND